MQLLEGLEGGADEIHENQRKLALKKDPTEGGEQGSEGRIEIESRGDGISVTCHYT